MSETSITAGAMLRAFIERIERLTEEKKAILEDIKSVYGEAKGSGFNPKIMRRIVRRRGQDAQEISEEEIEFDTYLQAMGMSFDAPLYEAVRGMASDTLGREQVIDTLQLLIPINGEIIAKVGGAAMRLWRDEDGKAHAEEYVPARAKIERTAAGTSRSVLEVAPTDPLWHVRAAADRADTRSRASRKLAEPAE
jgi:uncharacterized protein (UPF0335 family)